MISYAKKRLAVNNTENYFVFKKNFKKDSRNFQKINPSIGHLRIYLLNLFQKCQLITTPENPLLVSSNIMPFPYTVSQSCKWGTSRVNKRSLLWRWWLIGTIYHHKPAHFDNYMLFPRRSLLLSATRERSRLSNQQMQKEKMENKVPSGSYSYKAKLKEGKGAQKSANVSWLTMNKKKCHPRFSFSHWV